MNECYLLLGTNLGDKQSNLAKAFQHISEEIGEVITVSSIYRTAAWGKENQEYFLNQVLKINTKLTPQQALGACLTIEQTMGRVRKEKWGERLIDIDILYFGDITVNTDELKIPHPEIIYRRFTLVPLVEIAAEYVHPVLKQTNSELLAACQDQLEVIKEP